MYLTVHLLIPVGKYSQRLVSQALVRLGSASYLGAAVRRDLSTSAVW